MKALNELMEVIGNDYDSLLELVDSFLEEAPELLSTMANGLKSGDTQMVARSAHTLKSSARDFGLLELSDCCMLLEKKSKAGILDEADSLASQINALFQQGKEEIGIAVSTFSGH